MNEVSHIESFLSSDLEISNTSVLRLLGAGNHKPPLRETLRQLMDEERLDAVNLVDARAVHRSSSRGLAGSAFVDPSSPYAAVVCTIGPAPEARVTSLLEKGDRTRAVIADAAASVLVESLADICDQRICRAARSDGLRPGRRLSPGYGAWPLEEQRALFDFLAPSSIGVTLTERAMMVPRKSISFIVPLDDPDWEKTEDSGRCGRCELERCPYRVLQDVEKES